MKLHLILSLTLLSAACSNTKLPSNQDLSASKISHHNSTQDSMQEKTPTTEAEWKEKLSAEEYRVLREKGTERAHTGAYDQHWDSGIYVCKGCGTELFTSETKFDAHCGWPSFYKGIDKSKIKEVADNSYGMSRIEVQCANCGGHLGHVFNDGPEPTGLRYCINSVSLGFEKKKD